MRKCVTAGSLFLLGYWTCRMKMGNRLKSRQRECNKYLDNYQMLNHWLTSKNAGNSLDGYFKEKGYQSIAIYGMGDLANRLYEDLGGSDIRILYGIDRDVCNTVTRIGDVYSPDDRLPDADAIIVTPFYDMNQIKAGLKAKVDCPIVSLEEVIWSM